VQWNIWELGSSRTYYFYVRLNGTTNIMNSWSAISNYSDMFSGVNVSFVRYFTAWDYIEMLSLVKSSASQPPLWPENVSFWVSFLWT
jgi:hypothetical protein